MKGLESFKSQKLSFALSTVRLSDVVILTASYKWIFLQLVDNVKSPVAAKVLRNLSKTKGAYGRWCEMNNLSLCSTSVIIF